METAQEQGWRAPVPAGAGLPPHLSLLSGQLADAVALQRSGVASGMDIDAAMRLGAGYPRGPFEVLDDLGADASPFGEHRAGGVTADHAEPNTGQPGWLGPAAVVGTGHMAGGIVEAVAHSGRQVTVLGRSEASLEQLRARLTGSVERAVVKGRTSSEDAIRLLEAVELTLDPAALGGADVVVEAVAEDLAVKRELFGRLDSLLPQSVPLTSNTSSFGIAEIAGDVASRRPVLGLHFFNPAQVMKLVEVITTPGPGETVESDALGWVRSLGKTPVRCADSRGFIVNRLLIPFLNDAARLHECGVPVDEIDSAMVERAGHPMGPFALIDLIGLDVTVAALDSMAEADDDPRLVPAAVLRDHVAQGRLGRKSGRGFHEYGAIR